MEVEDSLTLYFDTIDVLPYSLSEFCFAGLKKGKDINEIWEEIKKKGDGVLKIEHTVYYEKRKAFIEKLFGLEKKAINRFEIELFSFSEGHVVWERDFEIYFEDDFLWKPESIIVGLFDAIGKELQEEGYIKQTKPPWVEDIERTHRRKENRKEH